MRPSIREMSLLSSTDAISSIGESIVVSDGEMREEKKILSMPITEMSSGTRMPFFCK